MSELLDVFLKANTNVEQDVYIKRFDDYIRIKALLEEEINEIKEQATFFSGRGKNRKKEIDENVFNGLLIAKACINIDFGHPKMLEKYKAVDAGECVRKALFAGEIIKLQEAIFRLSGFDDNFEEELEEAKN